MPCSAVKVAHQIAHRATVGFPRWNLSGRCYVQILHRPGWDTSRVRGHSSLPCGVEVEIKVEAPLGTSLQSTMTVLKMKDGEQGHVRGRVQHSSSHDLRSPVERFCGDAARTVQRPSSLNRPI